MFRSEPTVVRMNQNPTQRHFGEMVAAHLTAAGMTLRDVSALADIPLATLHRRLRSQSMSFTLGELDRIARALGTTASALVGEWEAAA